MTKKTVKTGLLVMLILICLTGCGKTSNAAKSFTGTWYSVEDETMYNFSDGQITVSGVTVGQYEEASNYIVVSLQEDSSNTKMYIATAYDATVLSSTASGDGYVYFCRGLDDTKKVMQAREKALQDFCEFLYNDDWSKESHINGVWVAVDSDAPYKSIDISLRKGFSNSIHLYHSDSSPKKGTYIPSFFEYNADNETVRVRLKMKDRGYESPTAYLYVSNPACAIELWIDKSSGSDELIMEFHGATYTELYKKGE